VLPVGHEPLVDQISLDAAEDPAKPVFGQVEQAA